jgi:hypothetical protein
MLRMVIVPPMVLTENSIFAASQVQYNKNYGFSHAARSAPPPPQSMKWDLPWWERRWKKSYHIVMDFVNLDFYQDTT